MPECGEWNGWAECLMEDISRSATFAWWIERIIRTTAALAVHSMPFSRSTPIHGMTISFPSANGEYDGHDRAAIIPRPGRGSDDGAMRTWRRVRHDASLRDREGDCNVPWGVRFAQAQCQRVWDWN